MIDPAKKQAYFEEFEKVRDPNKIFVEKPGVNEAFRTGMELL